MTKIKCTKCQHEFDTKSKNPYYVSCSYCKTAINRKKGIKNYKENAKVPIPQP